MTLDDDVSVVQRIQIPYVPRRHILPIHNSPKRFQFVCVHRRGGKSVGLCNHSIRAALQNKREFPIPRYAYVGPSFDQTKDLIWGYYKYYLGPFGSDVTFHEGDLKITLPNRAQINLYGGAQAYQRMRGIYIDGVVMDEFSLLHPAAWPTVIRPTLADFKGWAVASGTSNGDDHFHELKKLAEKDSRWDTHIIPVTETDALDPEELVDMTADMSPEQYAREMLCSFDAPIEGAYYAELMNEAQTDGRITGVPHDPAVPVYTSWDLGIRDYTSIWFFQFVGQEIHFIDYEEDHGLSLPDYYRKLGEGHRAKYNYGGDIYPHDIRARELGSGKSREEVAREHNRQVYIAPNHKPEDGINAVRVMIPLCWFDAKRCEDGLSALKNYHSTKSDTLGFTKPNHNWASHGADSMRMMAMGKHLVGGWAGRTLNTIRSGLRRRRGRFTV